MLSHLQSRFADVPRHIARSHAAPALAAAARLEAWLSTDKATGPKRPRDEDEEAEGSDQAKRARRSEDRPRQPLLLMQLPTDVMPKLLLWCDATSFGLLEATCRAFMPIRATRSLVQQAVLASRQFKNASQLGVRSCSNSH